MPANYSGATTVVTIDPAGTPVVVNGKLLHFAVSLGERPAEFLVLWLGKSPSTVTAATYNGKVCTLEINGDLRCTGVIGEFEKYDMNGEVGVTFTVIDAKHKINAFYIGQNFLETLDSDGLPTSFANGLAYYGADIVFNRDGLPNRNIDAGINEFVPPGYEHNTAGRAYWTFGQALQWLWEYCVEPLTGIAMPVVDGDEPEDWTFGGMDKRLDRFGPLLGMPMAACIDALLEKTRVQWTINEDGEAIFFAIGEFTDTLNLTFPTDPNDDDQTCPFDMRIKYNVMDSVGRLDIIGGRQQREVLLGTTYTGSVYSGNLVLTDTDFEQVQWFGIEAQPGWLNYPDFITPVGTLAWSNYNVQRYIHIYLNQAGWITGIPNEYTYRYNVKPDVYEDHKIGKNLSSIDQPYKMMGELLVARDKNGQFVNPDQEDALGGVSPLEMLKFQYPDGCSIDLDRGYLLATGVEPFIVNPLEFIAKPYFSTSNPLNVTLAFECAYRSWVSQTTAVAGLPYQNRRAVVRDELIHKTREETKVMFPEVAVFDALGNKTLTDGVTLPTDWTKNFVNSFTEPLQPWLFHASPPAGIVVDGMAELNEVKSTVAPYVGIVLIGGSFKLPGYVPVKIGTNVLDASGVYELGSNCLVTAVVFSDDEQMTELQITNRLGMDVTLLAEVFIDQRGYRSNP